jgi:hypothetical protein
VIASTEIMKRPTDSRIVPSQAERKLKSAIKPIGQTRRTFLKKTSATGLAAVVSLPSELDAQTASTPSGSWYPMSDTDTKQITASYADVVGEMARILGVSPAAKALFERDIRAGFGWPAAGGNIISAPISQTIAWEEWRTAPAELPTKFRGVAWRYGGNPSSNTAANPVPGGFPSPAGVGQAWFFDLGGNGTFSVGGNIFNAANTFALPPFAYGNVANATAEYTRTLGAAANMTNHPVAINPIDPKREYQHWRINHSAGVSAHVWLAWPPPNPHPSGIPWWPISPANGGPNHFQVSVSTAGGPTILDLTDGRHE